MGEELRGFKDSILQEVASSRAAHDSQLALAERVHHELRCEMRNAEQHVRSESIAWLNYKSESDLSTTALQQEASELRASLGHVEAVSRDNVLHAVSRAESDAETRHSAIVSRIESTFSAEMSSELHAAKAGQPAPAPLVCPACPPQGHSHCDA